MLQHWGTADVSNFSTPGTLTSRAVTPEQPKGDSGGEPAVLAPWDTARFSQGSSHGIRTCIIHCSRGNAGGRLQVLGHSSDTAGAREASGPWVLTERPCEHLVLSHSCSQMSWGRGQHGRDPTEHLHGDFALFLAEPCAEDKFLSTLQIPYFLIQIPNSYFKRKKSVTPENTNLCLVLTFSCHFTLPNEFCPFPVLSHTKETPSAQPVTKTTPPLL